MTAAGSTTARADDLAPELHTAAFARDPYRLLGEWRDDAPVQRHAGTGFWFLLGFDEVETGLATVTRGLHQVHDPANPFAMDGTGHTGPRRLVTPKLTNRAVGRYRDRVQRIVDDALADKRDGDTLEVVTEIGNPLPYLMTCELLGVPEVDDVDQLREWTWKSLALIDPFITPDQKRDFIEATLALEGHIAEVVAHKRDHLADDLMSTAITAGDAGEVMTPDQVVPFLRTIYLAGMHTTINQVTLGLLALLQRRSQWELLVSRPELLPDAVEEVLRYEPTAQYMNRISAVDVEIGGVTIPADERIVCWIASANRDPAVFGADADVVDVTRVDAVRHIAFGKGPHVCIGSWLARLELRVVFETLLSRFPGTELITEEPTWPVGLTAIRGPEELHLRLGR